MRQRYGATARGADGRRPSASAGGGKSGHHRRTVPGNTRRGQPQGQCNREQTAKPRASACGRCRQARVKGCGKSAPQPWQQGWHGKPHRVQDRIGMAQASAARCACRGHPGWLLEVPGNRHPRGMAIHPLPGEDRTRLIAPLATLYATAEVAPHRTRFPPLPRLQEPQGQHPSPAVPAGQWCVGWQWRQRGCPHLEAAAQC
jgi:hypothetical protein